MIDYILKFASLAAAKTALATYLKNDSQGVPQFAADYCVPGIVLWRASQDAAGTATLPDGSTVPTVTHTPLAGYFVLVSLPIEIPALRDNAAVQVVIDRDKANARLAGAVIKSNVSNAILQDIRFQPVFAGSDFPWGALN